MVQQAQPQLYEELRKLNLHIVPQGYLNTLVVKPDLGTNIKTRQNYCSEVDRIKKYLSQGNHSFYHVRDDGALLFKGRLVVPRSDNIDSRSDVMKEAHDTPLSIHPGSTKMYQDIRQWYWWPDMKRDIAKYVAECDVCRRIKAEYQRPAGLLQPLEIPEWKWDKVEMHFITGFP